MKAKFAILALSLLLATSLLASPAYADGSRGRSRRHRRNPSNPSNPTNPIPTNPTTSTGNLVSESTQTATVDNDQKIKEFIFNGGEGDGNVYSTNKNKATNVALNANVPININRGVAFSALDDPSANSLTSNSAGNQVSKNTQTATVDNDQKIKSTIINTSDDGNVYSDNKNKATNVAANVNVPVNFNRGVAFTA